MQGKPPAKSPKPKTPRQREKEKAQRAARKIRKAEQVARRKVKRAAKAAPKNRLARWSKRVRSGGKCDVCGKKENLQAHHVLPKERYPELKFKRINGVCLCPTHHKFGKFSAHRNPIWFAVWLKTQQLEKYLWAIASMGQES